MSISLYLRLLARESRGSLKRFAFFVACLAVGVAAVVSVAGLSAALAEGVRREARQLLAADISISSLRPLPDELHGLLDLRPELQRTEIKELVTMAAVAQSSGSPGSSQLVELKVVEGTYPFYGVLEIEPAGPLGSLLSGESVVVAPDLLSRLALSVGEEVLLGGQPFRIAGVVQSEPDQAAGPFRLGPRVFLDGDGFERADLDQLGSRISRRLLLKLPPEAASEEAEQLASDLRDQVGEYDGIRVRTYKDAQETLQEAIQRVETFLGLVALLSLLLGALGVAQTTRAWLASRIDAIAIYRCLGLRPNDVTKLYLGHAILLGLAGGIVGAVAGSLIQRFVPTLIGDLLPVSDLAWWTPGAVARGMALGVGLALLFTLAPLLATRRVSPLRVLRKDVEPVAQGRGVALLLFAVLLLGIWTAAALQARDVTLGSQFTLGILVAAGLLSLAAFVLMRSLAPLGRRLGPVWARHGVGSLSQPGAATLGSVVAVGLGVILVSALGFVERGLSDELRGDLPTSAPTAFLIDIQPDQWPEVERLLREQGSTSIDSVAVVTARLRSVDGRMVAELAEESPDDEDRRWALTREQRLTYMRDLPDDNSIIAGELWSDPEVSEVSVEEGFAKELSVEVGSRLGFDIQGMPLELAVTSIRTVDWRTFGINFFLVVEPGVLEDAPQVRIATAQFPEPAEQSTQDLLAAEFPNVTLLKIRDLLDKIARGLERMTSGVRFLGSFSILAGILILAGGISAGSVQRGQRVALLKTLGMTRREVAAMMATEYALIGAVAGLIGTAGGALLSWFVLTRSMELSWQPYPGLILLSLAASVLLTALTGIVASWGALQRRPLAVLRAD
jgi:putative ABC transport system permease protein